MKHLSLILRIVAILAAGAAAFLFSTSKGKLAEKQTALQNAQAATKATKGELASANSKISSLEKKLTSESKALESNKEKLQSVRDELYTVEQELSATRQQIQLTQGTVNDLQDETSKLKEDLILAADEKSTLAAKKEREIAALNERTIELEAANEELQTELTAAEAFKSSKRTPGRSLSASTTDSGEQSADEYAASSSLTTTIASISLRDSIIVLNVTAELGISTGQQILLSEDSKTLAKIDIIEVTEQFALANILPGTSTQSLAVGTSVKLLN